MNLTITLTCMCVCYGMYSSSTISTGLRKCLLSEPSLNFPPSTPWRKFPQTFPPLSLTGVCAVSCTSLLLHLQGYVSACFLTFLELSSIAPMGKTSGTIPMLMILQGGGLLIDGGDLTMTNCNIYENTASVSTCFLNLP